MIARNDGAEVIGGERLEAPPAGFLSGPALFVGANQMRVAEEIFGPAVTVIKIQDFDGAVAVTQDTDFGLWSGICASSLGYRPQQFWRPARNPGRIRSRFG